MPKATPVKGEPIRFTGGKYLGCTGWLDSANGETDAMYYVIVAKYKGKEDKPTRVLKKSVEAAHKGDPASRAGAILEQQPKIEKLMKELAWSLAKCRPSDNDMHNLQELFGMELSKAREKLAGMGSKAQYFHIDYKDKRTT
jgi:hypothetical protein